MTPPKAFPENLPIQNLKKFQRSPIRYMEEAVRQYASPVDLNLPIGKFCVVNDPDQAHHILALNHVNYLKSKGYKEIALVLGNGLLTAEGAEWQQQRKTLQPMFHKNELRDLVPAIWETGEHFFSGWGDDFYLHTEKEMSKLTLSVLLSSLVRQHNDEIIEAMSDNILFGQEFISARIRSLAKAPVWFPTKNNRRYKKMMAQIDRLVQRFLDDRKQANEDNVKDLLDVLIGGSAGKRDINYIKDELVTFLVAGHETSSLGLTWTLKLLAENSDVQEAVFQEVRNIADVKDIDLLEFSNLQYTMKVLKESMRLYPPIWNIVRRAKEEDEISGHTIHAGKQLMCVIYLIHRNEKYWPDPEKFMPERFDRNNMKNWHKYQYLPFGGGPRFCIGNNFAMFEMMVMMVLLVKNFTFTKKDEQPVGFNPLLTLKPDREILLRVRRRK